MRNEWFLKMRWPKSIPCCFLSSASLAQSLPHCHYLDLPLASLSPTHWRSPSHLLLRALDECGGLIAFFRERISMSCPECSGLMHKEQAARAQKWGPGNRAPPPLANQSHFKPRLTKNCIKWPDFNRWTTEICTKFFMSLVMFSRCMLMVTFNWQFNKIYILMITVNGGLA